MNTYHQELLLEIKQEAKQNPVSSKHTNSYSGTKNYSYPLSNQQRRNIVKRFIKKHSNISVETMIELLNSLYESKSYDEKTMAGMILDTVKHLKSQIKPEYLDVWLNNLEGWSEVDSLCQSKFGAEDFLTYWIDWQKLIKNLAKNNNINKQRASLVLLTKPVRDLKNEQFKYLALEVVKKLKDRREILITKAISWLLRDMIKNYRQEVKNFLILYKDSLPKIAIRETNTKLATGKKT
ncbi:DNA alkylation repair protein [Candidatus Beckwithbacteria bacterium]|nr:DNA alkylation repair protein [Candidatus Beckwithbacteria bacterium]